MTRKRVGRARYCECCGDRFRPGGQATQGICHACTAIALEIIRVCGPEWVTTESVLFARNRERLQPLIRASTREGSAALFGGVANHYPKVKTDRKV